MSGRIRSAIRFARVMFRYRWAAASFALRLFEVFPGFTRKVVYLQDRYERKQQLKKSQQSIGYALGDRTIVCSLFGRQIVSLKLAEGGQATADQFFLNRPIGDAKWMIALARQRVELRAGDLVFDPGCGAGRHLYHFTDALGFRAIGVDVYRPAIEVAETANFDRRIRFHAESSIKPGFLETALPDGCDFVFINSWLNHVKDYPGYREFTRHIVENCRYLLIISSAKDRLDTLFDEPEVLVYEVREGTQYSLLRGRRPTTDNLGANG